MLQYYTVHVHTIYSQTQNNTYTEMNLSTVNGKTDAHEQKRDKKPSSTRRR